MKKFRFAVLLLVCLSIIGMSLAAQAQSEVTLTARTHDQLYLDYFNSRLAEWEALHPDITFTYDFQVDPNAPQTALQSLTAGEPVPDLLGIERGQFPNFMKNGVIAQYFLDLTDLVAADRADYAEGRMAIYSYEGRLYGLESSLTAGVHYYQPAIYEVAGLEVPTTWEEAAEMGPALGSAVTWATNDGTWFQMMFNQRGGAILDADANFVMGDETNRPLAIEVATDQNGYRQRLVHGRVGRRCVGRRHHPDCLPRWQPRRFGHARLVGNLLSDPRRRRYGGTVGRYATPRVGRRRTFDRDMGRHRLGSLQPVAQRRNRQGIPRLYVPRSRRTGQEIRRSQYVPLVYPGIQRPARERTGRPILQRREAR